MAPSEQQHAPVPRDGRNHRRLAGNDLDQAMAFFTAGYDLRRPVVRRTGPETAWDFAGVDDDRMSLRMSRFQVDLSSESRSDDEFLVVWIRGGRSTITYGTRTVDLQPGVPVVLPRETYELHHRDIVMNLVHLDRRFVGGLVGDPEFEFDALQRPSEHGAAVWRDAVRRLSPRFLDAGTPMTDVERLEVAEGFAAAALAAFPRRAPRHDAVLGNGPEHARLRRALEYAHAHAREPIGTTEIAAAAGLSPRGLQQSLRRHLEQTPGEMLRGVRLDGAHADLRHAEQAHASVADIARAWGFGHLGRFSAAYRQRFGELPSETLRSGR